MKKKSIVLIATVFALGLVACNGAEADTPVTTTTAPVETTTTVPETTTTVAPETTTKPVETTEAPTESTTPVETTTTVPETTTKPVETTPAPTTEAPTTEAPTETTTVEPETTTEAPTTTAEPETTTEAASTPVVESEPKIVPFNSGHYEYIGNNTYLYCYTDCDEGTGEVLFECKLKSGETATVQNHIYGEITNFGQVFKIYRPIINNEPCYVILSTGDMIYGGASSTINRPHNLGILQGEISFWPYEDITLYDEIINFPEDWSTVTTDNIDSLVKDEYKQYLRNDWKEEDFLTIEDYIKYYAANGLFETGGYFENLGKMSEADLRSYYSDNTEYAERIINCLKSVDLLTE